MCEILPTFFYNFYLVLYWHLMQLHTLKSSHIKNDFWHYMYDIYEGGGVILHKKLLINKK